MSTDNHEEVAKEFLEAHARMRRIAQELAPLEERYLSMDGLGSAGMEVDGVMQLYNEQSDEREKLVQELKRLRIEAGDDNLLAELRKIGNSEEAIGYIRRVPLREGQEHREIQKEKRKGWFGRFR